MSTMSVVGTMALLRYRSPALSSGPAVRRDPPCLPHGRRATASSLCCCVAMPTWQCVSRCDHERSHDVRSACQSVWYLL